jgi:hypothetical protein
MWSLIAAVYGLIKSNKTILNYIVNSPWIHGIFKKRCHECWHFLPWISIGPTLYICINGFHCYITAPRCACCLLLVVKFGVVQDVYVIYLNSFEKKRFIYLWKYHGFSRKKHSVWVNINGFQVMTVGQLRACTVLRDRKHKWPQVIRRRTACSLTTTQNIDDAVGFVRLPSLPEQLVEYRSPILTV